MKDGKNELREKKRVKKERKGIDVIVKMKVVLLFTVPKICTSAKSNPNFLNFYFFIFFLKSKQ